MDQRTTTFFPRLNLAARHCTFHSEPEGLAEDVAENGIRNALQRK